MNDLRNYKPKEQKTSVHSGWTTAGWVFAVIGGIILAIFAYTTHNSISSSGSAGGAAMGLFLSSFIGRFAVYPLAVAAVCFIIGAIRTNTLRREAEDAKRRRIENNRLAQQANAQKMQQDQLNELIKQNQMLMQQLQARDAEKPAGDQNG